MRRKLFHYGLNEVMLAGVEDLVRRNRLNAFADRLLLSLDGAEYVKSSSWFIRLAPILISAIIRCPGEQTAKSVSRRRTG